MSATLAHAGSAAGLTARPPTPLPPLAAKMSSDAIKSGRSSPRGRGGKSKTPQSSSRSSPSSHSRNTPSSHSQNSPTCNSSPSSPSSIASPKQCETDRESQYTLDSSPSSTSSGPCEQRRATLCDKDHCALPNQMAEEYLHVPKPPPSTEFKCDLEDNKDKCKRSECCKELSKNSPCTPPKKATESPCAPPPSPIAHRPPRAAIMKRIIDSNCCPETIPCREKDKDKDKKSLHTMSAARALMADQMADVMAASMRSSRTNISMQPNIGDSFADLGIDDGNIYDFATTKTVKRMKTSGTKKKRIKEAIDPFKSTSRCPLESAISRHSQDLINALKMAMITSKGTKNERAERKSANKRATSSRLQAARTASEAPQPQPPPPSPLQQSQTQQGEVNIPHIPLQRSATVASMPSSLSRRISNWRLEIPPHRGSAAATPASPSPSPPASPVAASSCIMESPENLHGVRTAVSTYEAMERLLEKVPPPRSAPGINYMEINRVIKRALRRAFQKSSVKEVSAVTVKCSCRLL